MDLRRAIATKLLEDGPPGFVVFHFDGDLPWSRRDSRGMSAFGSEIEEPAIRRSACMV